MSAATSGNGTSRHFAVMRNLVAIAVIADIDRVVMSTLPLPRSDFALDTSLRQMSALRVGSRRLLICE
jgi:hypothetical protein